MWSTREVAELAGTSIRAVRHYHEFGLLDEPERRANGYKQYGVEHLVRLIRIKHLTELGFTLTQVADMGDSDEHPLEAMRALDAELGAEIERLHQARARVGLFLRRAVLPGLPAEFADTGADPSMSAADRALITVLATVLGPESLQTYVDMLRDTPAEPALKDFDTLPADASDETRQSLARRLAPYVGGLRTRCPGLTAPPADAPRGPRFAKAAVAQAIAGLYNPAQLDVMKRVDELLT